MARHRVVPSVTRSRRGLVLRLVAMGTGWVVAGAMVVAIQIAATTAPARLVLHLASLESAPSHFSPVLFPTEGSSAVAIPRVGVERLSSNQVPAPMASLTKLMTATLILRDLPLSQGQRGPCLIVSNQDVANFNTEEAANQSVVKVAAGYELCEIDLLNGLFVHSANNYAELLVRLDQRTPEAFVAAMNLRARQLHMFATHYVDVSGIDIHDVSTAADLMHVVIPLMRSSLVRSIVRQTSVVLPVAGVVTTYTPLLGHLGVIGVKSGRTDEAGGCDVMALRIWRHGVGFDVYAIVLGQRGTNLLRAAGRAAYALAHSAAQSVVINRWREGQLVGTFGWNGNVAPVVLTGGQRALWWQHVPSPRVATLSLQSNCNARPLGGDIHVIPQSVVHSTLDTISVFVTSPGCAWRSEPVAAITFGDRLRAQVTVQMQNDVRRSPWWKGLL